MAIAGGIDLGGTKIEAQCFDSDWIVVNKRRVPTPKTYPDLVSALVGLVEWLREGHKDLPVGIAAAGMPNPSNGQWITANLPADGKPFVTDLADRTGPGITWLNDCRAFAQAESMFGAGTPQGVVLSLLLGTGIGGAVTVDGRLINDGTGQSGEFGHMPLPATLVNDLGLPLITCGCGRVGCYETCGSGPGMALLAQHLTGRDVTTQEITGDRDNPKNKKVWDAWCRVVAALIFELQVVVDPGVIVLGGGMSQISGLVPALDALLRGMAWDGFAVPDIRLAARGETAATLGAAYASWKAHTNV